MNAKSILRLGISLLLLLGALGNIPNAFAQPGPLCDDGPACGPWIDLGSQIWNADNDCQITVDHLMIRVCGGIPEITYSGLHEISTLPGGCEFFKDSSLWQLIDIEAYDRIAELQALGSLPPGATFTPIPNCPTLGPTQVQFITTACYIWQVCKYTTTGSVPVCDPPENNPGPAPGGSVDVWTWHDCGTACCKRTYELCKSGVATATTIHMNLISKQIVNPPGCSKNADGTWTTRQCNNGC